MLTEKMGDISFEHQGRRIQGMRMQNLGDCYVINGWESMPYDNHSGVVIFIGMQKETLKFWHIITSRFMWQLARENKLSILRILFQ